MSRIALPTLPSLTMPSVTMPSFDLSRFDVTALADLDDKVVTVARDAAYISIGFGVLAFQQMQVRRREITKLVSERVESRRALVDEVVRTVTRQAK